MQPKFKIRIIDATTDSDGKFDVNLADEWYNIPLLGGVLSDPHWVSIEEVDPTSITVNAVFNNLRLSQMLSINDMYESTDTRLRGLNTFVAKDEFGNLATNRPIKVPIVIWNVQDIC
jgi:hypothetical protein